MLRVQALSPVLRRGAGFASIWLGVALTLKVVASVVWSWRDYAPPNFRSDFLLGRQAYFHGDYAWAFYPHAAAGPLSLVLGLILLNDGVRRRFPALHRALGRVQIVVVAIVALSGFRMAFASMGGPIAGVGFGTAALATAFTAWRGWRAAVGRRFDDHRRWMTRCFALLTSAVVLRAIGGLTTLAGLSEEWPYQAAAWISWLGPLAFVEATSRLGASLGDRRSPPR